MKIRLEPIIFCPICGGSGKTEIKEATDPYGDIPGKWSYRRCQNCFSLWMDPMPIREDIPKLYPKDYYTHEQSDKIFLIKRKENFISQFWKKVWVSELSAMGYRKELSSLGLKSSYIGQLLTLFSPIKMAAQGECRYLAGHSKGKLLDVGCGNGAFLYFMKQLGWEVEGIEPDPTAAKICKDLGITVIESPIEECSLKQEFYDAITLSHVIEHLPNPKEVLVELFSSLKPQGTLVSISPNPIGKWAKIFGPSWRGLEPPRHLILISPIGFHYICEQLGIQTRYCELTTWRNEHLDIAQSKAIRIHGHCKSFKVSLFDKLHGYILSPWRLFFSPYSGEEVVAIFRKEGKNQGSALKYL
ncbi:class I SAM-dependent methyltransferase [Methylacidiphilum caldifontis]|uniref:class I SAM-dependent methyltransferase n=1 Tax=Methylacidiphilum caldifontis TaxID=2795386 RepID=UPI001A8EF0D5|nr:class I SAM-dependent methyltransferase [Methylacidiphilum caldifontis]QSR88592.1 class I SAM-dependent methyltransferase [Methylacidiphilum caldifontis]